MANRTITRKYEQENGYGANDGYKLEATVVDGKVTSFFIAQKSDNLSYRAMQLLAQDLKDFADLIEADTKVK